MPSFFKKTVVSSHDAAHSVNLLIEYLQMNDKDPDVNVVTESLRDLLGELIDEDKYYRLSKQSRSQLYQPIIDNAQSFTVLASSVIALQENIQKFNVKFPQAKLVSRQSRILNLSTRLHTETTRFITRSILDEDFAYYAKNIKVLDNTINTVNKLLMRPDKKHFNAAVDALQNLDKYKQNRSDNFKHFLFFIRQTSLSIVAGISRLIPGLKRISKEILNNIYFAREEFKNQKLPEFNMNKLQKYYTSRNKINSNDSALSSVNSFILHFSKRKLPGIREAVKLVKEGRITYQNSKAFVGNIKMFTLLLLNCEKLEKVAKSYSADKPTNNIFSDLAKTLSDETSKYMIAAIKNVDGSLVSQSLYANDTRELIKVIAATHQLLQNPNITGIKKVLKAIDGLNQYKSHNIYFEKSAASVKFHALMSVVMIVHEIPHLRSYAENVRNLVRFKFLSIFDNKTKKHAAVMPSPELETIGKYFKKVTRELINRIAKISPKTIIGVDEPAVRKEPKIVL